MTPKPSPSPALTRDQKIKALTEVIMKVVPDIVDADSGFRIPKSEKNAGKWTFQYYEGGISRFSKKLFDTQEEAHAAAIEFEIERCGLLNTIRPITLEDVLRVLESSERYDLLGAVFAIGTDGAILMKDLVTDMFYATGCSFVLGSPLHLQPDATIDFLSSILCPEKL